MGDVQRVDAGAPLELGLSGARSPHDPQHRRLQRRAPRCERRDARHSHLLPGAPRKRELSPHGDPTRLAHPAQPANRLPAGPRRRRLDLPRVHGQGRDRTACRTRPPPPSPSRRGRRSRAFRRRARRRRRSRPRPTSWPSRTGTRCPSSPASPGCRGPAPPASTSPGPRPSCSPAMPSSWSRQTAAGRRPPISWRSGWSPR